MGLGIGGGLELGLVLDNIFQFTHIFSVKRLKSFQNSMLQIHFCLPCVSSQVIRLWKLKLEVVVFYIFPILKVMVSFVGVCNI